MFEELVMTVLIFNKVKIEKYSKILYAKSEEK